MSLSATRARRSTAGNRWEEALAAVRLENGDVPDPDAEGSEEEFIGKDEEDQFASDFESTDEEEYAKQGIDDGERQVLMEEKAERREAQRKAAKSAAAPVQRILSRAMKGEPVKKKRRIENSSSGEPVARTKRVPMWDATRQSERVLTVKHKVLVQERLQDAAKRKAHAPRRQRQTAPPKTQDELIAAALELEEKNVKSLKEFLTKEEEKRAAARRIVRMKIEGPKLRWVSRIEQVKVKVKVVGQSGAVGTDGTIVELSIGVDTAAESGVPSQVAFSQPTLVAPGSDSSATTTTPLQGHSSNVSGSQPLATGMPSPRLTPSVTSERASTPAIHRRSSTPAIGPKLQVYVELPSPARRSTPGPSQPFTRSPLSISHPLPKSPSSASPPLVSSLSQSAPSIQPRSHHATATPEPAATRPPVSSNNTLQPPNIDTLLRPDMVRHGSVSSTSSSKSRVMMCVELPTPKGGGKWVETPTSRSKGDDTATKDSKSQGVNGEVAEVGTTPTPTFPRPIARRKSIDSDLFPPGGPNFAVVIPTRKPPQKTEKHMQNYVAVDLGGKRPPFGKSMQAVFGDHANWEDVIINGAKPHARVKPVCAITGLEAPYRDPRTGIPYANAYAYKMLTRLLAHEFVWSKERGCYIGKE